MATNKIQTIYWFESSTSMYSAINKLFTGNLDMEHFGLCYLTNMLASNWKNTEE